MRKKKQLKELYDKATVYNEINNVLIKNALERLKQDDLTDESRIESVEILEQALETRDNFGKVKTNYKEREAEDRGYWTGISGALLGTIIAEFGPKIYKALKKK